MKKSDLKIVQTLLQNEGLYAGAIDGIRGDKTDSAVKSFLLSRPSGLPEGWNGWRAKRKAVACLQVLCHGHDIDAGIIDGFYGPRTEAAAHQLKLLHQTGSLPRGFGDIVPVRANPHQFPVETEGSLTEYYGPPVQVGLVRVPCPWTLRLDWNLS